MRSLLLVAAMGLVPPQAKPSLKTLSALLEAQKQTQAQRDAEVTKKLNAIATELASVSKVAAAIEKDHANDKPQTWAEWFWPPNWSDWALVLLGVSGTIVAVRTLRALEKQVRSNRVSAIAARRAAHTAERQLLLTQRADVLVETISTLKFPLTEDQRIGVWVRNFGPTRADKVQALIYLGLEDEKPRESWSEEPVPRAFGPGDKRQTFFNLKQHPTLIAAANAPQAPNVVLQGDIVYWDVFGIRHVHSLRSVFDRRHGTWITAKATAD